MGDFMDFEVVFNKMIFVQYYTSKELMYDKNVGVLLSPFDYQKFIDYKKELIKKNNHYLNKIELKSFNDSPLHFAEAKSMLETDNSYLRLIAEDFDGKHQSLLMRNLDDMTLSRIYSEVEGTLNIESVPTTRKVVDEIASGKRNPKSLNEQIIKNMIEGIRYISNCPPFTEENLFKLYSILSKGCLDEEDKLLPNHIYRHDGVEVGAYKGCPVEQIKECMNSLFEFVNNSIETAQYYHYLPHIAHYYILYVHPYFDYNGRTARMVSFWISLLENKGLLPPVISEAINQTKAS